MKESFNFTVGYYFPVRYIWMVAAALASIAFLAVGSYVISAIIFIIGIASATTRYGIEINLTSHQYQEYLWVLGFRQGDWVKFGSIQYLFIKDFKFKQTFNSRVNSSSYSYEEYRGYIKFSEQDKVHILSKDDYNLLVKELTDLANRFQVGLVDYSFGQRLVLK
jgi:hypothetical protein